jgi:predicted DNA-binding transcriptional regulator AlpA
VADLESIRVLSRSETLKMVGLSDRTWDRLEARGETPPKTRLSLNRIGYPPHNTPPHRVRQAGQEASPLL